MIRLTLFLAALITSIPLLNSQKIDVDQLKGMKIRNIGPATMSGRVTSIEVDTKNNILYAGTASGGLWKSAGGGVKWEPIFDKQPLQSIGAVAVNPSNPAEIWAGTGEGNPRNSQNSGEGIYKSIDAGKTWKLMGLKDSRTIHRIIINSLNPDIVTVATLGSAWGPTQERGVFKTTDGGKTWRKILYVNDLTGCADLVADPSNPNKLIACMWEYYRKPWYFNSGGKGSGIYITYDGGETWQKKTDKDGLPKGDLGRCGVAIARSKPNILYAVVEAKENAIYKSTDGGDKWQKVGENGDRPFYYAELYVDPKNENRLYNIFSRVARSEDGGKSWTELLNYNTVHPDHHAFWIDPNNSNNLIDGNDGGLNISHDAGTTWQFAANIPVGQFYHVNVDNEIPYNLYGGLQDNGSWVGPSSIWKAGGIRNADWQEVAFGDGFDAMPRRDNTRFGFAQSQGGSLVYFDRKTGETQFIKPNHPKGEILRYNWNAALAQDPASDCGVYFGSQYLHKSMDCGQTWQIISPDLTTNDTAKLKADISGGLTPDATNAENHCTILCVAPSPKDPSTIWVGTDDGNLQLTTDGGKTWNNLISRLPGCPKNPWIPQIEVSTYSASEAFVIVNNYRQNDWRPMAYHTTDLGKTWERIVDENKVNGYCWSIVQDPTEKDLLFLGTDYGLYFTIDGGKIWNKWTNDYPSVSTADLKIHPRDADLVVATFGRSYYILDDIRPLREIAHTHGDVLQKDFKVFQPADAYIANFRSVDGERFNANAIFEGQNKSPIAHITIWNKPKQEVIKEDAKASTIADKKKEASKAAEAKKVKVQILNESGDTIRTFRTELDTGMNRITWNLLRKGFRHPSHEEPKEDTDEPGGSHVLPGTYKAIFTFEKNKDSTSIIVRNDPRSDLSLTELKAKSDAISNMDKVVEKATASFNRLKEADKTIATIDTQLVNAPDTVKNDIAKQGKSLKDSIANLMKLYMQPKDAKGINRSPKALSEALGNAQEYLESSKGTPNQNTMYAVAKAKDQTKDVLEKVNTFFEKDWAKYRQKVEAAKYSLFKKYDAIKLD